MIEQLELDLFFESASHKQVQVDTAYYTAKRLSYKVSDDWVLVACDNSKKLLKNNCVIDEKTGELFVIQKRQWAVDNTSNEIILVEPTGYGIEEYLVNKFKSVAEELKFKFPVQFDKRGVKNAK